MRTRRVQTAVGEVELRRAWYLCPHCHNGQCPADATLDIEKTDLSPGVRRMLALVGGEAPFDHGRRQIELLAGLDVTTKAVERTAEAIGADIAAGEQQEIQRALQLSLPIAVGQPIPILYVEMDGTGIPVVKAETEGRPWQSERTARTYPARQRSAVSLPRPHGTRKATPSATRTRRLTSPPSNRQGKFGPRLYLEAWKRGWERAEKKVVIGDGAEWIWNIADDHFPGAVQIVDIFSRPPAPLGCGPANYIPARKPNRNAG